MSQTFADAFGDLRAILQTPPLETQWTHSIDFNENPTWEGYRRLDLAPFTQSWLNLQLDGVPVGDASFTELVSSDRMRSISFLNIQSTEITRKGLRALGEATHIAPMTALYLPNTKQGRLNKALLDVFHASRHLADCYM